MFSFFDYLIVYLRATVSANGHRWTRSRDAVSFTTTLQVSQCASQRKKKKKNYSACEALMLSATRAYLCNAFMTWTQISSTDTSPSWFSEIEIQEDPSAKWERLQLHLGKFVDEFVMTEFDIEKSWCEQLEQEGSKGSSN